jgi:cytochrome c-type biogenesis protein CcmH
MTKRLRFIAISCLTALATVPFVIAPVGAQQASEHAMQFGMKIKCMCRGCDMAAGICSHPGGAFSGPCETAKSMLREVDQHIAKGETDEQILQAFAQEYGSAVYAEPPKSGFSLVAWAMPSVYLLIGVVVVIFVILRWRKQVVAEPEAGGSAAAHRISPELLERARAQAARDTED